MEVSCVFVGCVVELYKVSDEALMSEAVQTTSNDDGAICVRCTIPADINATACVVIAHPAGSLDEIETLVVMNGAVNCTQVPDSQAYYVATFGRLDRKLVTLSVSVTCELYIAM